MQLTLTAKGWTFGRRMAFSAQTTFTTRPEAVNAARIAGYSVAADGQTTHAHTALNRSYT
jgi:hypothetical protein